MQHARNQLAALVAATLLGAAPAGAAEKSIGLTSFDRIVLTGDFLVEVVTKAPLRAVVSGSPDALDRVEVRSNGGILTISDRRFASARQRGEGAGRVVVRIQASRLRGATVAGTGALIIDRLSGARVELVLRGPGALTVGNVTADRLALSVVGNGKVTLAGVVKSAEAAVTGAGVVEGGALAVTDLIVNSEGAGDQRYLANRTAQGTLRGIGRLQIDGKAKCSIRNFGSGTLVCGQP